MPFGDECPPGDDAISLVPADAYLYVHIGLDPDTEQVERALDVAETLPLIATGGSRLLAQQLGVPAPDDFLRLSRSWRGDEAAFAFLPGAEGRPRPLTLLAMSDGDRARRSMAEILEQGKPRKRTYRGVEIDAYRDSDVADLDGFLAVGSPDSVRAAIDLERGAERTRSLSDDDASEDVRGELPDDRLADAYVSADGIDRLLAGRSGLASQLDTFTNFGASRGIAAAAVAEEEGIEIELESALDPERAEAHPSFFSAFPDFTPSLADEFPGGALAYLGIANPSETVQLLLEQAAAVAPGIVDAFDRLNRDLRRDGGVDLEQGVLPLLRGEAAASAAPGGLIPFLSFVFTDVDEGEAREAIARLQGPLIEALGPERTGQAAGFDEERVDDVTVRSVRLSPAFNLAYAIFDGKLVVSTDPMGVRRAIEGGDGLDEQDDYQAIASDAPDSVSALLFLNLEGLVRLAEPRGLAQIEPYVIFRSDIAKLRALGLSVESDEDSLSTRLFVEIEKAEKERGD